MMRFFTTVCITLLTLGVVSAQSAGSPLTPNQWIQPTEAGVLTGRVIVPGGDGMAQAVANASVALNSVDLGGRFPNVAEISAANMNEESVYTTISRYRPPNSDRVITMVNADLDALADDVINVDTYRVIQFDGGMNGKLYAAGANGELIPAPMTNVFIMRSGVEIGRAVTSELGDFRVDNLPIGGYSLLAIGRHGVAAIGFELVAQGGDVAGRIADGKHLVSAFKAADACKCQLCPWQEGEQVVEPIVRDPAGIFNYYGGGRNRWMGRYWQHHCGGCGGGR